MSYWSHNPEKLKEVTINALPEPWRTEVKSYDILLDDVPDDIRHKAMMKGTEDYFADMTTWSYAICPYGGC